MRIMEGRLRAIVRARLLDEAVTASHTSHSQGWIDPDGEYHYDRARPDHGEWALHVLPGLDLQDTFIDRLGSARGGRYGLKLPQVPGYPDPESIYYSGEIDQSLVSRVASELLLGAGWGKVTNAFTLSVDLPSRRVLRSWLDLAIEAGADPDDPYFTIYSSSKQVLRGTAYEVQRLASRLDR
jgi:hypothetical protein